jgi:uncharacterized cupin superfamily protein
MTAPKPNAIHAASVSPRSGSNYPPEFAKRVAGRAKHALGDSFGLANFGINLTRLPPGTASALRHAHSKQDELVYILEGEPVLITDAGETPLKPGMCAGFKAGSGDAHCLINRGAVDVLYLEVGDRSAGDVVDYPDDDLRAEPGPDGKRRMVRKDGTPV